MLCNNSRFWGGFCLAPMVLISETLVNLIIHGKLIKPCCIVNFGKLIYKCGPFMEQKC